MLGVCPQHSQDRDSDLVTTQGREDESILTHNTVRELLLPILILSRPQGECELGQLGLTELSEERPCQFPRAGMLFGLIIQKRP